MKCECNYHLGMGPNLLCPEHGKREDLDRKMKRLKNAVASYERAFEQMKIDNDRRKYFNEMATMQQIEIAEAKINE